MTPDHGQETGNWSGWLDLWGKWSYKAQWKKQNTLTELEEGRQHERHIKQQKTVLGGKGLSQIICDLEILWIILDQTNGMGLSIQTHLFSALYDFVFFYGLTVLG